MMNPAQIERRLVKMNAEILESFPSENAVLLTDYQAFSETRELDGKRVTVWTKALQRALDENALVRIPESDVPYDFDGPVLMNSGNRICADGATMRLLPNVRTLLLRNRSVTDGSDAPEDKSVLPDENLSVEGGTWVESRTFRQGYGSSGCFDENHSMPGVSTLMLFSNVRNLSIRNVVISHAAGFGIQIGNAQRAVAENVSFVSCFADGVHLNGNIRDVLVRNITGEVGDDLVALNPYDWDNSGINFGPAECVMIDGVVSGPTNPYKAIRILPGIYEYRDGSESDCYIDDLYLRRVKGIKSYKLYLQTPPYRDAPEHPARVGHCGNLYFEELDIDLDGQIDAGIYESVRYRDGYNIFGAFEVGANIELMRFDNIRLTLHTDEYPESCLVSVGPKSICLPNDSGTIMEIFDPYISCKVRRAEFHNITVNGDAHPDPSRLLRVIEMRVNPDFPNTLPRGGNGRGEVEELIFD